MAKRGGQEEKGKGTEKRKKRERESWKLPYMQEIILSPGGFEAGPPLSLESSFARLQILGGSDSDGQLSACGCHDIVGCG